MHRWAGEGENSLWLFTVEEFDQVADGQEFECINGNIVTKGKDEIDMDTRFNHIAYGVRNPFAHGPNKELFLLMRLKSK